MPSTTNTFQTKTPQVQFLRSTYLVSHCKHTHTHACTTKMTSKSCLTELQMTTSWSQSKV